MWSVEKSMAIYSIVYFEPADIAHNDIIIILAVIKFLNSQRPRILIRNNSTELFLLVAKQFHRYTASGLLIAALPF